MSLFPQSFKEEINRLEKCADYLRYYASVLRGEAEDHTGLGIHRILCDNLEFSLRIKILSLDEWEYYKELQEKKIHESAVHSESRSNP